MANAAKGEVAFKSGDAEWTLRFNANALCELEDLLDMPAIEAVRQLEEQSRTGKIRVTLIRGLFWAGLRQHHPDATPQIAGEIITDIGFPAATEHLREAFNRAFPRAKGSSARPQTGGKDGTGTSS